MWLLNANDGTQRKGIALLSRRFPIVRCQVRERGGVFRRQYISEDDSYAERGNRLPLTARGCPKTKARGANRQDPQRGDRPLQDEVFEKLDAMLSTGHGGESLVMENALGAHHTRIH